MVPSFVVPSITVPFIMLAWESRTTRDIVSLCLGPGRGGAAIIVASTIEAAIIEAAIIVVAIIVAAIIVAAIIVAAIIVAAIIVAAASIIRRRQTCFTHILGISMGGHRLTHVRVAGIGTGGEGVVLLKEMGLGMHVSLSRVAAGMLCCDVVTGWWWSVMICVRCGGGGLKDVINILHPLLAVGEAS
jgi:hypothetical protein